MNFLLTLSMRKRRKAITGLLFVPETYLKQFRSQAKSNDQTFSDHAFNLNTLFKRWLVGIDAYGKLERFRVVKPFCLNDFESLSDELKIWIVDRNPKSLIY